MGYDRIFVTICLQDGRRFGDDGGLRPDQRPRQFEFDPD